MSKSTCPGIFTATTFSLFFSLGQSCLVPFLSLYFLYLGLSPLQTGLLLGAKSFTGAFSSLFWTRCFATTARKAKCTLILSSVVLLFSYLVMTILPSLDRSKIGQFCYGTETYDGKYYDSINNSMFGHSGNGTINSIETEKNLTNFTNLTGILCKDGVGTNCSVNFTTVNLTANVQDVVDVKKVHVTGTNYGGNKGAISYNVTKSNNKTGSIVPTKSVEFDKILPNYNKLPNPSESVVGEAGNLATHSLTSLETKKNSENSNTNSYRGSHTKDGAFIIKNNLSSAINTPGLKIEGENYGNEAEKSKNQFGSIKPSLTDRILPTDSLSDYPLINEPSDLVSNLNDNDDSRSYNSHATDNNSILTRIRGKPKRKRSSGGKNREKRHGVEEENENKSLGNDRTNSRVEIGEIRSHEEEKSIINKTVESIETQFSAGKTVKGNTSFGIIPIYRNSSISHLATGITNTQNSSSTGKSAQTGQSGSSSSLFPTDLLMATSRLNDIQDQVFAAMLVLVLVGDLFASPVESLADRLWVSYIHIKEMPSRRRALRYWGALGAAVGPWILAASLDRLPCSITLFKFHRILFHFFLFAVFQALALLLSICFPFGHRLLDAGSLVAAGNAILEDHSISSGNGSKNSLNVSINNGKRNKNQQNRAGSRKPDNGNQNSGSNFGSFSDEQYSVAVNARSSFLLVFREPKSLLNLVTVLIGGMVQGGSFAFMLWLIHDTATDGRQLWVCAAVGLMTFGEFLGLILGEKVARILGHPVCLFIATIVLSLKCVIYSFLNRPWMALVGEGVSLLGCPLMWAAMRTYPLYSKRGARRAQSDLLLDTLKTVHLGLGQASGCMLAGWIALRYGFKVLFWGGAVLGGAWSVLLLVLYPCCSLMERKKGKKDASKKKRSKYNKISQEDEGPDYEDDDDEDDVDFDDDVDDDVILESRSLKNDWFGMVDRHLVKKK